MSNKKKSHGKKLTPTQHLPDIGFGTLLTTVLAFIKNDDAWSKIDFQDMYRSKHTLGGPINYRTMNSSSKIAELKHNLMHKCTTFLASRLFHCFSMSALSGSTPYHIALSNKISSIAQHNTLTVLCTRFLPKTLTYLKLRTRAPKCIPYNVTVRKYSLSQYIRGERTLSYYFVEVHAALSLC